jgi:hypothetical protein
MKKSILFLFLLLGLSYAGSAHVTRYVNIERHNGFFGFYSWVDQQFMGYTGSGIEVWNLMCQDPGFVRCRIKATGARPSRDAEIVEIEDNTLADLMLDIEQNNISQGTTTGQVQKHYQSTLSDGSTADIYMTVSWQPDPNDSNASLFYAEISDN